MANVAQVTTAEYTSRFNDQMSAGAEAAAQALEGLKRAAEGMDGAGRRLATNFKSLEASLDPAVRLTRAKADAQDRLTRQTETLNKAVASGHASQEQANRRIRTKGGVPAATRRGAPTARRAALSGGVA